MVQTIYNKKKSFSPETIKRLSLYLRNLRKIKQSGLDIISSDKITKILNVSAEQFRKDLSCFGGFGKPGIGYDVENLIKEIENILGIDKIWKIALVGAGRLGSALLGFDGFSKFNLRITRAFDSNTKKISKVINGIKIEDVKDLKKIIEKDEIKVAIVSTPPENAQEITDELITSGIKGILNFAPVVLKNYKGVFISNVDMACELESLLFFIKER